MMPGALPLLDEARTVPGEGRAQGLRHRDESVVQAVAEGQRQHELPALSDIELAGQGDVAIGRTVELPVHAEIVRQVLPLCAANIFPRLVSTTFPLLPRPPPARCGASRA